MNNRPVPPMFGGLGAGPSAQSLDMSPALQQILAPSAQPAAVPSYQQGGLIQPGGPNAGVQQGPMDPKMLEMQVNQFAQQHPQELAQVRQVIMQELQSGNLTPQELNQIVQLATVAAQNPAMYPQIRQFAIQQGIATEQDLPPQYDQGLVVVLLIAAKAAQQDLGGSPAGAAPANGGPIPSMAKGGPTPSGNGKPMIIEAHEDEYMIPKEALMYHGKKTFDAMVAKAREDKMGGPAEKA